MSTERSPAERPLLALRDVSLTLGDTKAVRKANLTLYAGQRLALIGPNGAGKSSLLRLMRGEVWPDQRDGGRIVWYAPGGCESGDDSPLTGRAMISLISPALQTMYMRQDWSLRGEDVVLAGLNDDFYLYREPGDAQRAQVRTTAALLGAQALLDMKLPAFSQGQLRLILLIRALIRKPALLLLDEAADGLDARARSALLAALESLFAQADAPALVLSTHRPLPPFITGCLTMDQGRLSGPADPVMPLVMPLAAGGHDAPQTPSIPKTLLRNVFGNGGAGDSIPCRGSLRGALPPQNERGVGLVLRNASVFIARTLVLREVDWEVAPGEHWAVTGANGSGKSTLLRLLMGHENVAAGGSLERRLDGRPLTLLEETHKYLRLVSDRLQALYTYDDSAADVVSSGFDGTVGLYREPLPHEEDERNRLLEAVGMSAWRDSPFRSLSTGQARLVLLARALAGEPRLLLLDEPFSGLDPQSRRAMRDRVSLLAERGLQIILVSHHEEDLPPCIGRRAVMEQGRLQAFPAVPRLPRGEMGSMQR